MIESWRDSQEEYCIIKMIIETLYLEYVMIKKRIGMNKKWSESSNIFRKCHLLIYVMKIHSSLIPPVLLW